MKKIINDTYNIAYNYLKDKYGYKRLRFTYSFDTLFRKATTVKKQKEMIANATDSNYILQINSITEDDDKAIELLMSQFYLGIAAKHELENKLYIMGIIS
jgi:hypothetical protein